MYNLKKYRIYAIILFILLITVLLILSVSAWNSSLIGEFIHNKSLLVISVILILIIGILKFIISYRLSDKTKIDENIKIMIEKERAGIIAEFEKKDVNEDISNEKKENINEIVNKIIAGSQDQKTLKSFAEKLLSNISKEIEIVQGLFYAKIKKSNSFTVAGEYSFTGNKKPRDFKAGETLTGQAAKNKEIMIINEIPDKYYVVESGLGKSLPKHIIMVPIVCKNISIAVMELGTFKDINATEQKVFKELSKKLVDKINKFIK